MKDESAAPVWSMERAMQERAMQGQGQKEEAALKPVPSQFVFEKKEEQVNYCMSKLRHVERKDAAAAAASSNHN